MAVKNKIILEDEKKGIYNIACAHCNKTIENVTVNTYHPFAGLALHFICHECSLNYRNIRKGLDKLK